MTVEIQNILVFGDSLSDRGTMAQKAIGAFSGLWGTSPHGRFTNGFVWLDYLIKRLAQNENEPVALIPPKVKQKKSLFSINNDEYVGVESAPVLARTYCVGGMTAADYSDDFDCGKAMLNATRKVLDTLGSLREEAIRDDEYMGLDASEKKSTLVIEWSGANDLITANENPTRENAKRAVDARIQHLREMIKAGYREFALFNMPDLSLTPRYQNGKAKIRRQAHEVSQYFNEELERALNELRGLDEIYNCNIHLFDANALFTQAFENPDQYNLDESIKSDPFINSSIFRKKEQEASAEGYMFWDEVHPTEAVHVELAEAFFNQVFAPNYRFAHTLQPLVRKFQKAYGMQLEEDISSSCGMCRTQSFDHLDARVTPEQIVQHGISQDGKRTNKVLRQLGWMDKNNQCESEDPRIIAAFGLEADQDETGLQLQAVHTKVL